MTDTRHVRQSELTVSDKAEQTAGNVLRQRASPSPISSHTEIESVPRRLEALDFQKQLEESTLRLKVQVTQVLACEVQVELMDVDLCVFPKDARKK